MRWLVVLVALGFAGSAFWTVSLVQEALRGLARVPEYD